MEIKEFCKKINAVPMSVIEDIKTEIKEIRDSWELDCYHDEADALTLAIKIINKHISGDPQEGANE